MVKIGGVQSHLLGTYKGCCCEMIVVPALAFIGFFFFFWLLKENRERANIY